MPKILCLETATSVCSVALCENEDVLAYRENTDGFRHAELLTAFVDEVLKEVGSGFEEIDAIAVSSGPGSYTGLRIGMSVAKGFCYAAGLPLLSIPTLQLIAAKAKAQLQASGTGFFCPMIDARRMEVYCALYDRELKTISPPAAIVVDENFFSGVEESVYFFGDGAAKCSGSLPANFIHVENIYASARFMAAIACRKFQNSDFENVALSEPFYLKEFIAGRKKST